MLSSPSCKSQENCFSLDAEDMPRHQPPLPIVTTSGSSVTQQQQFSHASARQRPPAERPGQLGGKTVTVKAVCRSDIQGQKGGAGTALHRHSIDDKFLKILKLDGEKRGKTAYLIPTSVAS